MSKVQATIKNYDGSLSLDGLRFNGADEISLRLYVDADTAETWINATRADFVELALTGEEVTVSRGNGQELLDEGAIEISTDGGTVWVNFCTWANAVDLGPILAGNDTAFKVRINPAASLDTIGTVGFGLAIRIIPA